MLRAAAAGLALLALAAGASTAAAQEPRPARIAFDAGGRLYTVAADGSDRLLVAEHATEPAWSPDGGTLAWTRFQDDEEWEGSRLWLSAPDGGAPRRLTNPPRGVLDVSPTWSPDGQRIAFVRVRFGRGKLVTTLMSAPAGGGEARRIAQVSSRRFSGMSAAAWSPDGARILVTMETYADEEPQPRDLHVVDVATDSRRLLLRNAGHGSWSPDGARIAYVGLRPGCEDIRCEELYLANADGGGRRRLTTNESIERSPTWSPGGDRLAFVSDRNYPSGGRMELYSMGTDGSCLTWLTNGTADPTAAAFERGAGLSGDPGGCGATAREPLLETDMSELAGYDAPVWWLGARFGDLLLSEAEEESGNADVEYEDCARYEPADCPAPVRMTSLPACASSFYFFGDGSGLSRHQGALLYTPPDRDEEEGESVVLITGSTTVFVDVRQAALRGVLDGLRPLGSGAPPPGGLPRAGLPVRFLRALERTTAAARKYGARGAARRLGISRGRVRERLAVHRKLRGLGPFARLDCR